MFCYFSLLSIYKFCHCSPLYNIPLYKFVVFDTFVQPIIDDALMIIWCLYLSMSINCGHNTIISRWRHKMEVFSALLAHCEVNSPVNGVFPSQLKVQWRGALMFSLVCAWTYGWADHRYVGDLRFYHVNYDVTVMFTKMPTIHTPYWYVCF